LILSAAVITSLIGAGCMLAADPEGMQSTESCDGDDPDACASFGSAWYFTVVTIASVGYGDVLPRSATGRVVASILILIPFPSLAIFTGKVAAELMLFGAQSSSPPALQAAEPFLLVSLAPIRRQRHVMLRATAMLLALALLVTLVGAAVVHAAGPLCFDAGDEGCEADFLAAWWFCICTFGMVGYGEVTPSTDGARTVTAVYILFCLPIYPLVAGAISAALIESRQTATGRVGPAEIALPPLEPLPAGSVGVNSQVPAV